MSRKQCIPLIALLALPALAVAQVQLEFGPPGATWRTVLRLQNGYRLLVGFTPRPNVQNSSQLVLAWVGANAFANTALSGSGNTVPAAAAVDPAGNVWIVGHTNSDDLPLVNPVVAQKSPYRGAGFVMKLDATAQNILFSTYLGGKRPSSTQYFSDYSTSATAMAIDHAGNVYVGGTTDEPDFLVSNGIDGCHPSADSLGETTFCSFLMKFGPSGKLIYSTLVTTGGGCLNGGSACIGRNSGYGGVNSIAVDSAGAAVVAGLLGDTYSTTLHYTYPGGGYICRIAPDGSRLLWVVDTPTTYGIATSIFAGQDLDGNIDLFGGYIPLTKSPNSLAPVAGTPGLFAAQLKPDGSALTWSKDLGQDFGAAATGLLLDSQGDAYLTGTTSSAGFPQPASGVPKLGPDFVLKLDSSGSPVQPPLRLPRGVIVAPPSFGADRTLMLLGAQGSLLTIPADYNGLGPPAIVAVANAASYALNAGLFPGALLVLYGFNLPGSTEGMRVLVGGIPAPILYTGPNQINLQAPFKIRSDPNIQQVELVSPTGNLSVQSPLGPSLGLFSVDGTHAAALNEDGTPNSRSNPAALGSVVSLFGTGAVWLGALDGETPTEALPFDPDLNQFGAFDGIGTPLNILYAGAAPGLIDGVFQIKVQITAHRFWPDVYPIVLHKSGGLTSNAVQVYIK